MYEFWEVGRGRWYEQAGVVSWSAWEDFGGFSAGEQHVHKAGDPGPLEPAPSAVLKSFLGGASGEWVCTLLLPSAPLSVLISFCSHLSLSYGSWGLWGIFESNQPHNVCFSLLYLKILCYFMVYIPLLSLCTYYPKNFMLQDGAMNFSCGFTNSRYTLHISLFERHWDTRQIDLIGVRWVRSNMVWACLTGSLHWGPGVGARWRKVFASEQWKGRTKTLVEEGSKRAPMANFT